MTHYTTETIPAREHKRATHMTCDLCGATSPQCDGWGKGSYNVSEVTIAHRLGVSYPDSGDSTTTSVDLCPICFSDRLLPWLTAQGAKPTTESHDW